MVLQGYCTETSLAVGMARLGQPTQKVPNHVLDLS
jgi:hypothetical protein